ncbi:MAG: ABC transporter substrate-binding protein [Geminicoccaceae bacterium]|nr:MAG: ABC transporter substrate-binding protein [Geminicoccaceae bacterium]
MVRWSKWRRGIGSAKAPESEEWTLLRAERLLFAALLGGLLALPAWAGPPDEPFVVTDMPEIGRPGGDIRTLIGQPRDARMFLVFGYARLVAFDRDFNLFADILRDVEVEEGRIFTLHLRPGHRWSDGHPFTAEDFRFFWEDVAQHEMLRPTGPPIDMIVDGELPEVQILDELTVRYTWSKPNPFFLPGLAGALPLVIQMPAHYLKPLHEHHADPAELAQRVRDTGARDWAQLFGRHSREHAATDPNLPTLQPWRLRTAPPAERIVAERNPYFHRVDPNGVQLPYADRMIFSVVESRLIPVKIGGGEADMQARGLSFSDVTFLKESEGRAGMYTHLWRTSPASHLALFPNLNATDPVWRAVFRDVRVRRAFSLATDRHALSGFLYFGIADPANNTLLPESPLWREEIATAFIQHDPAKANALLDEAGLDRRGAGGLRLLPDGRPMEIVVETSGESTEHSDILELIAAQWRDIGVRLITRPSQREVLRNRIFAGETMMTIATGVENGFATADMSPEAFAPTSQVHYQWPMWGQHHETRGLAGEAPDIAEAIRLYDLFDAWRVAQDIDQRRQIWAEMLDIWADNVFTIGLISGVRQPVAVKTNLANVPADAIYSWDPGAHFGIYRPDTFWWR